MGDQVWHDGIAAIYDETAAHLATAEVLDPVLDLLVELADGGPVLELGIGTGRVGLPLSQRGLVVHGIDSSAPMVGQLRSKPGGDAIEVAIGDFATTRLERRFPLVYLVFNTITNLLTQDDQVACFRTVAEHLEPGGRFLIECYVPDLRRLQPGERFLVFDRTDEHLGYDVFDVVNQRSVSHHEWIRPDGSVQRFESPHRFVWPSELDLMARLAGLALEHRWAGWQRSPFTSDSTSHVSVWRAPA